ncbi:MAG: HaeIII family restriction endonuclease, partial [Gemmatimonadetes bacterium]|nr:HaeIII family restriction endonuclease [Gemmatimonadota bacterium]
MVRQTQMERGKAFEYAVALALSRALGVPLDAASAANARMHYDNCDEQSEMDAAAREAALFVTAYDKQLEAATLVALQTGSAGQRGDVRDVLMMLPDGSVGISAKTHHHAVKHSRLSDTIDFGSVWADHPVSQSYWAAVRPVFGQMREMRERGMLFRDVQNKEQTLYLPILTAFEDEFTRLCQSFGGRFIQRVFRYLIGQHDFYKVVRETDGVLVQSFNMSGTLGWGRRWAIPSKVD